MNGRWTGGQVLLAAAGLGLVGREIVQRLGEADLRGQVALVTGGSRGLGLLLARELASQGCRLAICARGQEGLDRARRDLERRGAEVLTVRCDVSDRAQVEHFVGQATGRFGRVDMLINNAGVIQAGPLRSMTHEDFEEAMAINFWGVVYPSLAVLPQMLERRSGRLVNIASIGGKLPVPHLLPYSCAKFAVVGFSEGLRAELARDGIDVVTIVPGLLRTGSHLHAQFKGDRDREFAAFSLAATLPFVSMDAERAARQIVRAVKRGEAERILSRPAVIGARVYGLFPGLTVDVLGLVNRFLPRAEGTDGGRERGMEVEQRMRSPVLKVVTGLGRSAARRFNQVGG